MENFELKPCPFCGNKDVELRQYQFVGDVNGVDVKVPKAPQINCGKCGTTVIVEWQGDGFIARYKNGVEIALASINECFGVFSNVHDERPTEG